MEPAAPQALTLRVCSAAVVAFPYLHHSSLGLGLGPTGEGVSLVNSSVSWSCWTQPTSLSTRGGILRIPLWGLSNFGFGGSSWFPPYMRIVKIDWRNVTPSIVREQRYVDNVRREQNLGRQSVSVRCFPSRVTDAVNHHAIVHQAMMNDENTWKEASVAEFLRLMLGQKADSCPNTWTL